MTPEATLASRGWFLFGQIAIGATVFIAVARMIGVEELDLAWRTIVAKFERNLVSPAGKPRGSDCVTENLPSPMLSILMPAYNEAHSITENVCETVETMHELGIDFEIVVIDDGSMDGTHTAASNALRAWPDHVRVVRCTQNEGKGNALICGASYAKGDTSRSSTPIWTCTPSSSRASSRL